MFKTLSYSVLQIIISNLFNKELFDFVLANVTYLFSDNSLPSEEKRKVVFESLKQKAKELGVSISKSSSNLLIEAALAIVKSKLG